MQLTISSLLQGLWLVTNMWHRTNMGFRTNIKRRTNLDQLISSCPLDRLINNQLHELPEQMLGDFCHKPKLLLEDKQEEMWQGPPLLALVRVPLVLQEG